jgi:hypothetical protein
MKSRFWTLIHLSGRQFKVKVYIVINSVYSNPWFWAGLIALGFAFVILNRYTRMKETSKTAKFLEKKEQEKKSE